MREACRTAAPVTRVRKTAVLAHYPRKPLGLQRVRDVYQTVVSFQLRAREDGLRGPRRWSSIRPCAVAPHSKRVSSGVQWKNITLQAAGSAAALVVDRGSEYSSIRPRRDVASAGWRQAFACVDWNACARLGNVERSAAEQCLQLFAYAQRHAPEGRHEPELSRPERACHLIGHRASGDCLSSRTAPPSSRSHLSHTAVEFVASAAHRHRQSHVHDRKQHSGHRLYLAPVFSATRDAFRMFRIA